MTGTLRGVSNKHCLLSFFSFYPYSENKGADQLCGYCEADLRLCFRICKKPVFSQRGSNVLLIL